MNFLELANSRYSTKNYDSSKKISNDKIEDLKKIIRLSPSSINSQPWRFVFVEDEAKKSELASVSLFNEEKVRDSGLLVVFYVADDLKVFEEQVKKNLPEMAVAYYENYVKTLPESAIKTWLQSQVYLSLGFFLSAAISMGLDSTPMEGIIHDEYSKIVPVEGFRPLFAVALGYRKEDDFNQPMLRPKSRLRAEEVVISI